VIAVLSIGDIVYAECTRGQPGTVFSRGSLALQMAN